MALKPMVGLTPGKAVAESLKRQFVYSRVNSPSGHTIILDQGHPTVNSRLSAIMGSGERALSEGRAKHAGDRKYMEAVAKQAAKYLGGAIAPTPQIARGDVVPLSTMIDNRALNHFAANLALAHSLGRKGFDAQVVTPGTKTRANIGTNFLVSSAGHFIDPVIGRVYSPSEITRFEEATPVHTVRLISKVQQPFDYEAARPAAEKRRAEMAAAKAAAEPARKSVFPRDSPRDIMLSAQGRMDEIRRAVSNRGFALADEEIELTRLKEQQNAAAREIGR